MMVKPINSLWRDRKKWRGVKQLPAIAIALTLLSACSEPASPPSSDTGAAQNGSANAEDWRAREKTLSFGISLPPVLLGVGDDVEKLQNAYEARAGLPVKLQRVNDYNGLIQAMAADQIDVAALGAGAYASLYDLVGEKTAPLVAFRDYQGVLGYYSTIMVRADSPYYTIEDLKGARVGYPDVNSTSGYLYPRNAMREAGIDPETYFSKTGITGGHPQAVMALASGQYDAIVTLINGGTPETGFSNGTAYMMAQKGLLELDDYRFIWFAGPLPQSSYVMRTDKDPAMIDLLRGIIAAMPYEEPGALSAFGITRHTTFTAVGHDYYDEIMQLRNAEIRGDNNVETESQ